MCDAYMHACSCVFVLSNDSGMQPHVPTALHVIPDRSSKDYLSCTHSTTVSFSWRACWDSAISATSLTIPYCGLFHTGTECVVLQPHLNHHHRRELLSRPAISTSTSQISVSICEERERERERTVDCWL